MFFSQFPKVGYDFNRTGTVQQMVNIFRAIKPQGNFIDDALLYKMYNIKNGARPDIISQELYGTPDFYWTFFVINDFLHDGMQAWPLSEESLYKFIETSYSGKALCFTPEVLRDADNRAQGTKNSVAGILNLGELVYGSTSGAVGRIVRKDTDLQQIILQDIIPGETTLDASNNQVGIDPRTGATSASIHGGNFQVGEFLSASQTKLDSQTLFSLQVGEVYDYANAPAYYYETNDESRRPLTAPKVIPSSTVYSELQWNKDLQTEAGYTPTGDSATDKVANGSILSNAVFNTPLVYSGGYDSHNQQFGIVPNVTARGNDITYVSNKARLIEINDDRSNIRIIDPNYMEQFLQEFEEAMNV